VVKCSNVLQCSDGLSNKATNIIRRQYEVAAFMYFTVVTFFRIFRCYYFINVYMVVFLFNIVIYIFLLYLCILIVCLYIFIVPAGTIRLP
jgi:hypothetical protein